MNPSRIFIERPVATSLLMVAIMLVGRDRLPVPAAVGPAAGRLSDHPRADALSRRQPRGHDLVDHRAARAPVRPDAGPEPDDVDQLGRRLVDHPAVRPQARPRRRRAAGPGGHQCRQQPAAVRPAVAADLRQGQPGRRAGADARRHLQDRAADQGPRPGRHAARPEDRPASRRRPGQPRGRPEARRAHPRQPDGARRLRAQRRRPAHDHRQRQRQHAQGQFRRPGARLHHQRQRPDHRSQAVQRHRRRLSQRRAGAALRRRHRRGGAGEQPAGRLGEHDPGGDRQRPPPARRQRHRGGRQHQGSCCRSCARPCRRRSTSRC